MPLVSGIALLFASISHLLATVSCRDSAREGVPPSPTLAADTKLSDVYQPPRSYSASLTFHIPYVPFSEPITAAVDTALGSMRLSYYAGQDVFIDSKKQPSYKIVPIDDQMECLNTTSCVDRSGAPVECTAVGSHVDGQWQHLFPNDLSLFKLTLDAATGKPQTETVQRCRKYASVAGSVKGRGGPYTGGDIKRTCVEPVGPPVQAVKWTFSTNRSGALDWKLMQNVCDDPKAESGCEGWLGSYSFYTWANAEGQHQPLQFKFTGHNIVLGGSHFDEYVFDYHAVTAGPVDSELFMPPMGMTCRPADSPLGPVVEGTGPHAAAAAGGAAIHPVTHPSGELVQLFPGAQADMARAAAFGRWQARHGKRYPTAMARNARAMQFHRADRHVNAHNRARAGSYWLATSHLADWTDAERATLHGAHWADPERARAFVAHAAAHPHARDPLPLRGGSSGAPPWVESVDWRKVPAFDGAKNKAALTGPPKDQGTCGSCWSFGAAETIEGAVARAAQLRGNTTAFPREVSQQNLLDCSWTFGNNACEGGLDWEGYEWMLQNNSGQIASAASYGPYLNQEGFCHFDLSRNLTQPLELNGDAFVAAPVAMITGWRTTAVYASNSTDTNDPAVLKTLKTNVSIANLEGQLISGGPVSISVDTPVDFYFYGGGVYDNPECTSYELDHTVLAIGFGTVKATQEKYWIVKNSWSSYWGESGFVRVAQKGNICGVATTPTYVTGLTLLE